MSRAVRWHPRGIGQGGGYASLATGRRVEFGPDLSGFVASREDAYALADLVNPVAEFTEAQHAAPGERMTYEDRCHIDFRPFEPHWLQVKFTVEKDDLAYLERLDLVARLRDGWLDKEAIDWVMYPDQAHRTPVAVDMHDRLRKRAFPYNEAEEVAISELETALTLSRDAVLRQALRLYQLHQSRIADGETCTWSGDAQRQRDFAGEASA